MYRLPLLIGIYPNRHRYRHRYRIHRCS